MNILLVKESSCKSSNKYDDYTMLKFVVVGQLDLLSKIIISIIIGNIKLDWDKYELNVTAMDDGECCTENRDPAEPTKVHTSTAVVVVFITDVNDNKPVFEDCASYSPKIEEGAPNGSPVIHVHAVDKDKGRNSIGISFLEKK